MFLQAIDLLILFASLILYVFEKTKYWAQQKKVYVQQKEKMIQGGLQTMPIDISKAIY